MSRTEFRWNKKRKHYAYIFKDYGDYRANILLSTDPLFIDKKHKKKIIRKNIKIFHHPNPRLKDNENRFYIINHKPYIDYKYSFDNKVYRTWKCDKLDKRLIKRFKKYKKHKKYFDSLK